MGHQQRYHARYSRSDREYLRKHSEKQGDSAAVSEHRVVKMQHTIGNQAVQRLLTQRDIPADSPADVQRAPNADSERPGALATIVLEHQGKLRGSSRFAGHEGKIELMSVSMGGTLEPSSGKSNSVEQRVEITLVKYVDDTSPLLMDAVAKGEAIKSAQFEMIKPNNDGNMAVYYTFDFSEGMITGFTASGSDGGGKPIETVNIQFLVKPKK